MNIRTVSTFLVLCSLSIALLACQYQQAGRGGGTANIVSSAPLQLTLVNTTVGKTVYVNSLNKSHTLRGALERTMEARGYAVTGQPSLADYIVYIHVLYAGEADAAMARQAVQAGYAQKAEVGGRGAVVLLADVLVAARSVPLGDKRGKHGPVVAATSSRHIVDEKEARLAAIIPYIRAGLHTEQGRNLGHESLELDMAEAVAEALPLQK